MPRTTGIPIRGRAGVGAACLALLVALPGIAAPAYTAVRLQSPEGAPLAASALNDAGEITGSVYDADLRGAVAFVARPPDVFRRLAGQERVVGRGMAINQHGDVAGEIVDYGGWQPIRRAALGRAAGPTVALFPGSPAESSVARGVNDAGVVVGAVLRERRGRPPLGVAFAWRDGRATLLGPAGGRGSVANAVNAAGTVVGSAELEGGRGAQRAVAWSHGETIDLGSAWPGGESSANAINALGWIAGETAADARGTRHACLWRDGLVLDLGTLGGAWSSASAIDDRGRVVGQSATGEGRAAFVWDGAGMRDLNSLVEGLPAGEHLLAALAINDAGEILARGDGPDGTAWHYLLRPRPPGTAPSSRD